jgi:hypothetical protein
MATLSCKKLALIQEDLRQSYSDDDVLKIVNTIRSHLDLDTQLEKQRVQQRRICDRQREATGSSYSKTDQSYYQRNKASLNQKRTELNRKKRAEAIAVAASANATVVS